MASFYVGTLAQPFAIYIMLSYENVVVHLMLNEIVDFLKITCWHNMKTPF